MSDCYIAPTGWAAGPIRIQLIGCGGTGSAMIDELFRMHYLLTKLGHEGLVVCAWDGDTVSEANVGRQRFWPSDVGWNKAELLVNRYCSFGGVPWSFKGRDFLSSDCQHINTDVILSCVDSAETRVLIGEAGKDADEDILWLDTGNDDSSGQVVLGHWAGRNDKKGMLPHVLNLYPGLRGQKSEERPSCSTQEALERQDFGINQRVAGEASGLLWQLIRYGSLKRHGSFIYQGEGEVIPLVINKEVWASFSPDMVSGPVALSGA